MTTSTAHHRFNFDPSRLRLARLEAWDGDNLAWAVFVREEARRLSATLRRTQTVVDEIAGIHRDRDLSKDGQRRKSREVAAKFLDDVRSSAVSLRERVVEALNWLPNLQAAPAVENTAAAISLDAELRTAFREHGGEGMVGPLVNGEHPELRRAIVRAPEFLSGLEPKQYAVIRRAAIAEYQRDLLELVADSSYVLKQFSAIVGNAFSAIRDAAGRSIDLPSVDLHTPAVRELDEMLREYRVGSINSREWLEAAISAQAKTPEIAKQRIDAAHEARQAALREGKDHIEAERLARIAADSVDPDEREPVNAA